jgi:hypothetical protein
MIYDNDPALRIQSVGTQPLAAVELSPGGDGSNKV